MNSINLLVYKQQLEQLLLNNKTSFGILIRKLYEDKKYNDIIDLFERIQQINPLFKDKKIKGVDLSIYNYLLKSLYSLVCIKF